MSSGAVVEVAKFAFDVWQGYANWRVQSEVNQAVQRAQKAQVESNRQEFKLGVAEQRLGQLKNFGASLAEVNNSAAGGVNVAAIDSATTEVQRRDRRIARHAAISNLSFDAKLLQVEQEFHAKQGKAGQQLQEDLIDAVKDFAGSSTGKSIGQGARSKFDKFKTSQEIAAQGGPSPGGL